MAELLVDFITSLDGYASAVGWPGYWGSEGPEYLAWLDESPERDYTVLMGATTYRLMSDFAATSDDPSFVQTDRDVQGGVLLDAVEPVGVGQHSPGRPGPGRGRPVDESRRAPRRCARSAA